MATQQETLRRLLLSGVATLMLACGLIPFTSAGEANAYSHSGCRVAKSSISVFNQSLAVKYNTATNGGKTRWNAQALKVTFSTASSASAADVLVVAGAPSSVTYWAVTEGLAPEASTPAESRFVGTR